MSKKPKYKKLYRSVMCAALSCVMALGSAVIYPRRAQAGIDLMGSIKLAVKVSKASVTLVDSYNVWVLNTLADLTGCETFAKVAEAIKIESKEQKQHDEIMDALNEMKGMLSDLETQINEMSQEIENSLNKIGAIIDATNLSDSRGKLKDTAQTSKTALDKYRSYLYAVEDYDAAYNSYSANPTEGNKAALDAAEDVIPLRMKEFADSARGIDFENVIIALSSNSCKQTYSYDPTRKRITPSNNPGITTLAYANLLCNDAFAFEHMKYQFLKNEANWEIGQYMYVMQANRAWLEFLQYERALTEVERRYYDPYLILDSKNLQQEADRLEAVLNIGYSCINDISDNFDEAAGCLMRPYDIDKKIKMNYGSSYTYDDFRTGSLGEFHLVHTSYAKSTSPEMDFYLVKPLAAGHDRTYLILKGGVNGPQTDGDIVYYDSAHGLLNKRNNCDYSGMTQDFLNVSYSTDLKYQMPKNMDDFNGLINSSAYTVAGNNMLNYLVNFGGLDKDKLISGDKNKPKNFDKGLLYAFQKAPSQKKITTSRGEFYCLYNAADLTNYNPKSAPETIKAEGVRNYGMLATLKGPNRSDEGSAVTVATKAWFTPVPSSERKYVPGTQISAYIPPNSKRGNNKGIALYGANGDLLEVVLYNETYDAFKEADGSLEVMFTAPYQDFTVRDVDAPAPQSDSGDAAPMTVASLDEPEPNTVNELDIAVEKTDSAPVFTDIQDTPAKADIELLAEYGVVSGTGGGKYSPDDVMTRGMFVTALSRFMDVDTGRYKGSNFSDVSVKDPMRPYIEWAYENGLVSGHGGWKFKPDEPISREQMALILDVFLMKAGVTPEDTGGPRQFSDADQISDWAKDAASAVCGMGILSAEDGKFNPKDTMTRAEVAAAFAALLRAVGT